MNNKLATIYVNIYDSKTNAKITPFLPVPQEHDEFMIALTKVPTPTLTYFTL